MSIKFEYATNVEPYEHVVKKEVANELLEALQWALPMAILAMEQHRMERVKNGHRDISGTYKNGESWVGIYQDEVDKIEFARAAIAKATGETK